MESESDLFFWACAIVSSTYVTYAIWCGIKSFFIVIKDKNKQKKQTVN